MSQAPVLFLAVCAGAAIAGAVFFLVFFSARKNEEADGLQRREEFRGLLELAEQKFEPERVRHQAEMEEKRRAVEVAVGRLSEQLKETEGLVRAFEAERREKYGSLDKSLKDAADTTGRLAATTESLRQLLDNRQARGQWGERMAEDILRASGLQENLQYLRNRAQETVSTRPDYTFLLPDDHKFHMDVKFPLDNYLRLVNARTEEERGRLKADFLKDVKARIREVQRREYINPAEQTLDYVLLFIPNEQVYGFIHESWPGLIDEALSQKVVLCSPFTLYAVLSVVRQAFDNFHFTRATQEVVKLVSGFSAAYEKFRERFSELGERLGKASELYHEIAETGFRRLESAVQRIEKVRRGQGEEPPAPAQPAALPAVPGKPRE